MIPDKETLLVEFKSDLKSLSDNELIETAVGFSNTQGGTIFLGVEDNGQPTGLHANHQDHDKIVPLIANKTVPPISVSTERITINDIDVICIHVPQSNAVIATSSGKILRRVLKLDGTPETVPMYPFQINTRLSDLSRLDYSAEPVRNASVDDLDPLEHQRLRNIIKLFRGESILLELSDEELDQALHLTTRSEGQRIPTVVGLLLVGKEDRLRELLPTATAAFQVLEGTAVKMNEQVCKPLLSIFELFETYLKAWNPEKEVEYGLFRLPIPEFDHRAFREALINAFAHRDYTVLQSTRIQIDEDGLSITSPGGFIEGVSKDNLLTVEPHGRNPALSDALKRIGLAERTGRGIDRIYEGSIVYGRPLPDYSESTSRYVRVFIPRAAPDLPFVKMLADIRNRDGRDMPIASLMILSTLRSERRCDIRRLAAGSLLSESKCKAAVERLVEAGLVEAQGSNRGRSYTLSGKVYHEKKEALDYVRQRGIDSIKYPELVMKLAEKQKTIRRDDVCKLLGVNASQAYRILKTLAEQGDLILEGRGRSSVYKIHSNAND